MLITLTCPSLTSHCASNETKAGEHRGMETLRKGTMVRKTVMDEERGWPSLISDATFHNRWVVQLEARAPSWPHSVFWYRQIIWKEGWGVGLVRDFGFLFSIIVIETFIKWCKWPICWTWNTDKSSTFEQETLGYLLPRVVIWGNVWWLSYGLLHGMIKLSMKYQ